MLLEKSRERPTKLTGAVTMNHTNDPLIGEERFVQESLRARERFVHAATDDVEIRDGRLARLKLHMNADAWRGGRPPFEHAKLAQTGTHSFAADVDFCRAVMDRRDGSLQPERTDRHPAADGGCMMRGSRLLLGANRLGETLHDGVDRGSRGASRRTRIS